jgi:hypothetical protein
MNLASTADTHVVQSAGRSPLLTRANLGSPRKDSPGERFAERIRETTFSAASAGILLHTCLAVRALEKVAGADIGPLGNQTLGQLVLPAL